MRRKSAKSFVAERPVRPIPALADLACNFGPRARGASEMIEEEMVAGLAELTPFFVVAEDDEVLVSDELDGLEARALAAAMVAPVKRSGCGALLGGGSMELRKSIRLSSLRWLDLGNAVKRSSSSSSDISKA